MPEPEINPALTTITSSLFRVSAKLLVIQDEKLLVVHEDQGWYGLPGGGVDHKEYILEALVREINEEIGCHVDKAAISPQPVHIDSTSVFDGIPRLTLLYERTDTSERFDPSRQELSYKWVTPGQFASLHLAPNIAPMRDVILALLLSKDT